MGVHNRNKQYGFASVKPRDAEIINNKFNKKRIFVIAGSILALALIVWGVSSFIKSDLDTKIKGGVVDLFKKEEKTESGSDTLAEVQPEDVKANTASVGWSNAFSNTQKVKLALLASPDLFDYKNQPKMGCDALVFVDAEVKNTPKILNSTLNLLFTDSFNYGFPPANFIATTQKNLNFDKAVIENGVAKVFLTGEMTIENKDCDSKRVITQITETSKQFPTVKAVEIYLNNKKIEL